MREIKFRAWEPVNKTVVYYDGFAPFTASRTHLHLTLKTEHQGKQPYTVMNFDAVDLMQFTGITGLGGVEIYEGDVVKGFYYEGGRYHRFIGVVKFVAPSFEAEGVKQYAGRSYPYTAG